MIADLKASYHGDQDTVQVIAIVADQDSEGNYFSLHTLIDTATIELVYYDNVVASASFTEEHYFEDPDSDDPIGEFRISFLHYPVKRELKARLDVTLTDGKTAQALRTVESERDPVNHKPDHTNPLLAGRPDLHWGIKKTIDYDRNQ